MLPVHNLEVASGRDVVILSASVACSILGTGTRGELAGPDWIGYLILCVIEFLNYYPLLIEVYSGVNTKSPEIPKY